MKSRRRQGATVLLLELELEHQPSFGELEMRQRTDMSFGMASAEFKFMFKCMFKYTLARW
jgi:hypothetical protein